MTKFGVHAFSEALRQEALHAGVRVTVVAPGFVDTELQGHNTDPVVVQAMARSREQIGEVLKPEDIAERDRPRGHAAPHVCVNEVVVRPTAPGSLSRRKASRATRAATAPAAGARTRRMRVVGVRHELLLGARPPRSRPAVGLVVAHVLELVGPALPVLVVELQLLGELVVVAQLGARRASRPPAALARRRRARRRSRGRSSRWRSRSSAALAAAAGVRPPAGAAGAQACASSCPTPRAC